MRAPLASVGLGATLFALASCREGRRAPTEPPRAPAFGSVVVDFVFGGGDAGAEFRHPIVFLSGPQVYLVYALWANGQPRFAGCPGSCDRQSNWLAGSIRTERIPVLYVSAVLTGTGLHVVYDGPGPLRYATCPGVCYDSTHWEAAAADSGSGTPWFPGVAADSSGGLHAVYEPGNLTELHYAECFATCLSSSGWTTAVIDRADDVFYSTIGIDATGRIHVLYRAGWRPGLGPQGLKYATCTASCTDPANWSKTLVDEFEVESPPFDATPSLAIANDNRLHVAYWAPAGLRYATCGSSCSSLASWQITTVATPATRPWYSGSLALAIGPSGTLHLVYPGDAVHYARCAAACIDPTSWQTMTADSGPIIADYVALAVDSADQPHLAVTASGWVRYLWLRQ